MYLSHLIWIINLSLGCAWCFSIIYEAFNFSNTLSLLLIFTIDATSWKYEGKRAKIDKMVALLSQFFQEKRKFRKKEEARQVNENHLLYFITLFRIVGKCWNIIYVNPLILAECNSNITERGNNRNNSNFAHIKMWYGKFAWPHYTPHTSM